MNGSYRTADGQAKIEWTLEDKEQRLEFSASGSFQGSGGQCLEEISAAYPDDQQIQRIVAVWRLYHLNGMKAGLPVQEVAISAWIAAGNRYDYAAICKMLETKGLLVIPVPEGVTATGGLEPPNHSDGVVMYRYGTRWIHSSIPADVLDEIKSWQGLPARQPLHDDQAAELLRSNGLSLRVSLSDSKPCTWNPDHSGHHYRVTISRPRAGRLSFDFWGSASDAENGRTPTAHDVLACLSSDAHTPYLFTDFCDEFGYDTDSLKDKQTFTRASRFAVRLRSFFSAAELEQLSAIQ